MLSLSGTLFIYLIFFFSLSLVYNVHEWEGGGGERCIWHSTGGQVICGGKVFGEVNGCYDVNVRHPYSTGIKNCTSATVLCIFFFFFLFFSFSAVIFSHEALKNPFVCERKRKTPAF